MDHLVVNSKNGLFAVDPEDVVVSGALRMGGYGLDEIERLKHYITPNSRILIVGAHIGALAIPIAKLCKDVVAIEANPATYKLLSLNIELNSVANCRLINIAANDKNEDIEFLLNRINSGGSKRVPINKEYIYYYDNPEKIFVKAFRLDDYLMKEEFDIILMDIEGSEYFALQGMQDILTRCKVLVIEFVAHHLKNVSGVSVGEFLSVITPHFSRLTIPSKRIKINEPEFLINLTKMYEFDQNDDGIIFEKINE